MSADGTEGTARNSPNIHTVTPMGTMYVQMPRRSLRGVFPVSASLPSNGLTQPILNRASPRFSLAASVATTESSPPLTHVKTMICPTLIFLPPFTPIKKFIY